MTASGSSRWARRETVARTLGDNVAMVMPGPGDQLRLETRSRPDPGPGEALVQVEASSLNYHDLVNLKGLIQGPWPRVPMTDGCGTVVAVAEGVRDVAVGDRVVGAFNPLWLDGALTRRNRRLIPGDSGDGWLQRFKTFPANALVPVPAHLSDVEAATMVCAGTTAWTALRTGGVTAGDVVVTLGTGGVSMYALQLAKATGATAIITSSSDEKLEIAEELGADHTINYAVAPDWERTVLDLTDGRGADLVVDIGGQETLRRSIAATRMDGTVAVVGVLSGFGAAEIPVTELMTRQIRLHGVSVGSVAALRELAAAVAARGLQPHLSHTFDWAELAEAEQLMESAAHVGKIGIDITVPDDG